jgi:hypothetical protein
MDEMSGMKIVAIAAVSAAFFAGAPAGVAQTPAQYRGGQELLGGQGYGDRDRDWNDRDRDWRDGRGGMRNLEGLRVDSAKDALRRAGFSYSRAIRENGQHYDLWSNGRACVGFTSYNGRVTASHEFRDAECGDITRGRRIQARELEGLRVDAAKDALRRAGLSYSHAIRIGGRQYDLWSSYGRRDTCVGFASYNGRVTEARQFAEREC